MASVSPAPIRSLAAALCALLLARPALAGLKQEEATSPQGPVHLVHPEDVPKGLVLFLPGAAGWDVQARATAEAVAGQGHLVVALDWSAGPKPAAPGACRDLGQDLAGLAQWVEGRETLPKGALPILMGESQGAALVYAALLQSPPHRFHAALSLGFCPLWPAAIPPCRVAGLTDAAIAGQRLAPAGPVPSAWFLFPGSGEPRCQAAETAAFADRVGNARLAAGPWGPKPPTGEGDDLSPLASLMQWLDPRIPDQVGVGAAAADIAGLPLTEVRAPHEDPRTFAVMLSGDGGWAAIDRGVSAALAAKGIGTVGWDSLGYFWKARTPAEVSRDLERVLRHYLDAWHKERVVLIGYSFGADVLPLVANALPPDLRRRVDLAALLGLGRTAMLEFHLTDWLGGERGAKAIPVLPQVRAMTWTRRLCVYGADEDGSLCPDLAPLGVQVHKVRGDHHFDEDYPGVADLILKGLAEPSAPMAGSDPARP